jgi:hypothetical protein
MGRGVADHFQPLSILAGNNGDRRILGDLPVGIDELPVDFAGDGRAAQTGSDCRCDLGDRYGTVEAALAAIG